MSVKGQLLLKINRKVSAENGNLQLTDRCSQIKFVITFLIGYFMLLYNTTSYIDYQFRGTDLNYLARPIIPQATRGPEFPVFNESGWLVWPKSS